MNKKKICGLLTLFLIGFISFSSMCTSYAENVMINTKPDCNFGAQE